MLRARLSLCALEGRENPSGPVLADPFLIPGPAPVADPVPAPTIPAIVDIGVGIAAGIVDANTPQPVNPTYSNIFKVDLAFALPSP